MKKEENGFEEKTGMVTSEIHVLKKEGRGSTSLLLVVGVVMRVLCFLYTRSFLEKRPELTSPLVSYRRLQDGVAMFKNDISPYEGDLFHYQPLLLRVFSLIDVSDSTLFTIFTALDCITATLLSISAGYYAKESGSDRPEYISTLVLKCYLWNPVTIACSAVLSISVLHNVLIAVLVYFFCSDSAPKIQETEVSFRCFLNGFLLPCVAVISVCTSVAIYPVIIIASALLRFTSARERMLALSGLTVGVATMVFLNWLLNDMNWNFLEDTYGFILRADDLTPNVGLFWYFFIQVFEHFRTFYLAIFQINLLVYVVPLLLSLRKDAHLHLVISLLLVAVFSSYPTLNDASTYLALLPMFEKYKKHLRYTLVTGCTIVTCVVLMPVMWHMWIIVGSGNANFYFAVTLIYNVAQIYLMIDLMFAYFRNEADGATASMITPKTNFVLH
ncbi:hypothetical protein KIN20_025432 [Parelaphostrongylus tenuis]|uniref:GPI transamidase subunit PIG-U n=1 Tax=Parelaphostrongylus tenuis TaxID=148309 RepID=A0AAD5MV82_PARTN|nr:hypothetical protein KIN20_025432 [Parelaphostrongylus tenuis]